MNCQQDFANNRPAGPSMMVRAFISFVLVIFARMAPAGTASETPFERLGVYAEGVKDFVQISHYVMMYQGRELRVLDIGDPAHPRLRAAFPGGGQNMSFKILGNYLLVQVVDDRITNYAVYDFKDPLDVTPRIQGQRQHGSPDLGDYGIFATDGTRLFQIDPVTEDDEGNRHIAIKDVTTSPTTLAWRILPAGETVSFALRGGQLMAADSSSSQTIPLARINQSAPVWSYQFEDGLIIEQEGAPDPSAKPAKLTLKNTDRGLEIFETAAGSPPKLRSIYGAHSVAKQFKIAGKRGYLTDSDDCLQVLDMSNPAHPRCLGRYADIKDPQLLAVEDNLVFLGGKEPGFSVIDCTQPNAPKLRGRYPKASGPMSIQEKRAFVAAGKDGLQILDIADPAAIRPLGQYPTTRPAVDLATSGSLVYLIGEDLLVLDTTNPGKPVLLGKTPLNFGDEEEEKEGDDATSSPDQQEPLQVKKLGPALYIARVKTVRNRTDTTCMVIDVSDPTRPRPQPSQVDTIIQSNPEPDTERDNRSNSHSAAAPSSFAGWYLCLSSSYYRQRSFDEITKNELTIYDLANPLKPTLAKVEEDLYSNHFISLYKNTLYLTCGQDGLVIMRPAKH